MPNLNPFTHHEILVLVEPFTRRGRHVDLAASNRMERRLVFKPVEHAETQTGLPAMRETLRLENPYAGIYRLTRGLKLSGGMEVTLQVEGEQPAELLAQIEAVPKSRQFKFGDRYVVGQSYYLGTGNQSRLPAEAVVSQMMLALGVVETDGLTLVLKPPTVKGYPGDFELTAQAGDSITIPEDMLAVIGWDWAPLRRSGDAWISKLRLRGNEPVRSRSAESKLERTAVHLARTLHEAPALYHHRLLAARWGVVFRRGIPLLSFLLLLAGAASIPYIELAQESSLRMLLFNAPTILLAFAFCLQELPRFEIPPMPQRPKFNAWRQTGELSTGNGAATQGGGVMS